MGRAFVSQLFLLIIFLPLLSYFIALAFLSHWQEPLYSSAGFPISDVISDLNVWNPRNASISRENGNTYLHLHIYTEMPEPDYSQEVSDYTDRLNQWWNFTGYNYTLNLTGFDDGSDMWLLFSSGWSQFNDHDTYPFIFHGDSRLVSFNDTYIYVNVNSFRSPQIRRRGYSGDFYSTLYYDDGSNQYTIILNGVDMTKQNYARFTYRGFGPPWWWGSGSTVTIYFGLYDGEPYSLAVEAEENGWIGGATPLTGHVNLFADFYNVSEYVIGYYPANITINQGKVYKEAPGIVIVEG